MSKQIMNTEIETPKGLCLNDKDFLNNLLCTLKDEIKNYTIAMTEASNEKLYKKLKESCEELIELQRTAFEISFKNGWYTLELADDTKIKKTYNKLNKEIADLQAEEE